MAHSIKNPEILHWVEDDGRYACNKAVGVTPTKRAFYLTEITCKNCLKEISREKLSDQLTKFLHADKPNSCFNDNIKVQEMIQKAKILEERVAYLEKRRK
jgi:hypothetical protein